MNKILLAFLLLSIVSCARNLDSSDSSRLDGLVSPFPSTVDGIDIPGAHALWQDKDRKVVLLRAMAPRNAEDFQQLKNYPFTDVLIFKNEIRDEVQKEIKHLTTFLEYPKSQVYNIEMLYKDFPDFKTPCLKTIAALKIIKKTVFDSKRSLFLHCTVGEDRTGYLSGLFRLMSGWKTIRYTIQNEMCYNGYGAGNGNKPVFVIDAIRSHLTPMFLKMAFLIKERGLSWSNLDESLCNEDPSSFKEFKNNRRYKMQRSYLCEISPIFGKK